MAVIITSLELAARSVVEGRYSPLHVWFRRGSLMLVVLRLLGGGLGDGINAGKWLGVAGGGKGLEGDGEG